MDSARLAEVLQAAIDPNRMLQAEQTLTQIHNNMGFTPILLRVIMRYDVPTPVRQFGAIYLKKVITSAWRNLGTAGRGPITFCIHQQDRAAVRNLIVDAIIQVPDMIKIDLGICLKAIAQCDFPDYWPEVVHRIYIYLLNENSRTWMGALLCIYNIIINYENHTEDGRAPLINAMSLFLPMTYNIIVKLRPDQSAESVLIQKQVLKCFYKLVKTSLNLNLLPTEVLTEWMDLLQLILSQPVPDHTLTVNENKRLNLPWWKIKKWAIHILLTLFKSFGSTLNTSKNYTLFSTWYLFTFTSSIIKVLLSILDQYKNNIYVSPRVLQWTLDYLNQCFSIEHEHSGTLLYPHMSKIIQNVLFPMMCHSLSDDVLWDTDPLQYIEIKFAAGKSESLMISAQVLLLSACKGKKYIFVYTMQLCSQVLNDRNGEYGLREKHGALCILGSLKNILLDKKFYCDKMSSLLNRFIYPEFYCHLGYLRARACWVIQCFASKIRFQTEDLLMKAVSLTASTLVHDSELPVKVEAALAIGALLLGQEEVHGYLQPYVQSVTHELIALDHCTIEKVLAQIICNYTNELIPLAYEILTYLATAFSQVFERDLSKDEKDIAVSEQLRLMETVLKAIKDIPEILAQIEKEMLRVIELTVFHNIGESYLPAISLLSYFTSDAISKDAWTVLEMLYC